MAVYNVCSDSKHVGIEAEIGHGEITFFPGRVAH